MAGHLEHLLTALEAIEEMTTKRATEFQFNVLQCELLGSKVVEMREHLQLHADFAASSKDHCGPYFEELCCAVKRSKSFMQGCCGSDWVKKAVALGDSRSLYVEILLGLDWWCEVVRHAILEVKEYSAPSSDTLLTRYEGFLELLGKLRYVHIDIYGRTVKLQELPIDHVDRELSGYFLYKLNGENTEGALSRFLRSPELSENRLREGNFVGKGNYGTVVKDTWFGLPCAKKVISGELRKEATILTGLCHPHIVRIFYCWQAPDKTTSYIVMELMAKDLVAFLAEGPLTLKLQVEIMLQVAKDGRYLHSQAVAHRDLKGANILLNINDDGDVVVKLADFGSTKGEVNISTYGAQSTNVGTLRYKAPELFQIDEGHLVEKSPTKRYPFKADVYSFAMSGTRPQLPSTCPKFLESLLVACWENNPNNRPTFLRICEELQSFQVFLCRSDSTPTPPLRLSTFFGVHQLISGWIGRAFSIRGEGATTESRNLRRTAVINTEIEESEPVFNLLGWKKSSRFMLTDIFLLIH